MQVRIHAKDLRRISALAALIPQNYAKVEISGNTVAQNCSLLLLAARRFENKMRQFARFFRAFEGNHRNKRNYPFRFRRRMLYPIELQTRSDFKKLSDLYALKSILSNPQSTSRQGVAKVLSDAANALSSYTCRDPTNQHAGRRSPRCVL